MTHHNTNNKKPDMQRMKIASYSTIWDEERE